MKQLAILDYSFIFEPDIKTWIRSVEFEKDLADFFAAYGLQANALEMVGGYPGRRILYVESMDVVDKLRDDSPPLKQTKSLKGQITNAMKKIPKEK